MLTRLFLALFLGLSACGSRGNASSKPTPVPSSMPSASPSPSAAQTTASILPTTETQDAVLAEVTRLEKDGVLTDVLTRESYPVQITVTGPSDVITRLQKMAKGDASLVFTTLSQRNSRITNASQRSATETAEWQKLWLDHNGSDNARPDIDFEKQSVLAVFMGQQRTAGYSIKITQVRQEDKTLIVNYEEKSPAPDALTAQVLTSPAHLVQIERSKSKGDFTEIRFVKSL